MFKELWKSVVEIFSSWRNSIYFWRKKREALKLWKKTGRQWHLIPYNQELLIWDNVCRKRYNKKVKSSQKIDGNKLLKMAYFSTPSSKERIIKPETLKL